MHRFELADLIRVNQLVRGRTNFEGFQAWYDAIAPDQRQSLACLLCELAHQAGVDDGIWDEALTASGVTATEPVVRRVLAAGRMEFPVSRLYELIIALPEKDLPTVFRLVVHLFGTAEGKVYRADTLAWCNHWWHRDLLDDRVVRDLLGDPEFYMTAMKDDIRVKGMSNLTRMLKSMKHAAAAAYGILLRQSPHSRD